MCTRLSRLQNWSDQLNRFVPFEDARLSVEFGAPLDGNRQRPLDVFFGGDDVADPQADQVGRGDIRLRQVDDDFDQRVC